MFQQFQTFLFLILMQYEFFTSEVFEKLYELYCFQIFWRQKICSARNLK